jgi:TrmH family RNA methyltransferase
MVSPRECAEKVAELNDGNVAIVFGRENSGLNNEEMELGNLVLQIPTNTDYSSLNLASAVQIICYELFLQRNVNEGAVKEERVPLVSQEKIEMFYEHLEQCMIEVGYHDVNYPRRLMHRMRRLFNRAQLDESEWKILRGFLAKIQDKNK